MCIKISILNPCNSAEFPRRREALRLSEKGWEQRFDCRFSGVYERQNGPKSTISPLAAGASPQFNKALVRNKTKMVHMDHAQAYLYGHSVSCNKHRRGDFSTRRSKVLVLALLAEGNEIASPLPA